jgi:hypothetical protein
MQLPEDHSVTNSSRAHVLPPGPGRPPGSRNKLPQDILRWLISAIEEIGLDMGAKDREQAIIWVLKAHAPLSVAALLKHVPKAVSHDVLLREEEVQPHEARTPDEMVEEMADRGHLPEVLEECAARLRVVLARRAAARAGVAGVRLPHEPTEEEVDAAMAARDGHAGGG